MGKRKRPETSEVADLKARLAEAEETLRTIRSGEVDALVVHGTQGERIFSLAGAEIPYRLLVEAMNEGALMLLPKGTILFGNTHFASLAKTPMEQISGSSWERFFPPEEQPRLVVLLKEAHTEGNRGEFCLLAGDGSRLPVLLSLRVMKGDSVEGITVIVTDLTERKAQEESLRQAKAELEVRVQERTLELANSNEILTKEVTERKRAEVALRQSRDLLSGIIESTQDLVAAQDGNFRYLAFNQAYREEFRRIFGPEIQVGTSMAEALAHLPEEQKKAVAMWGRALRGEVFTEIIELGDLKLQRKVYEIRYGPIRDAAGHVIAAAHIVRDTTERKRAEEAVHEAKEQLARANEDLERRVQERTAKLQEMVAELEHFSYSLVHDMRAPLRSMNAFASIMVEEYGGCLKPEGRDYLQRISSSARRMDHLITDALQYSEVVRAEVTLEPVDVERLLRGMMETYPDYQAPHAEIRIEGPLPKVLGNGAYLTQCCSNLLNNAIKFVAPGVVPKVRIWAEELGDAQRGMRKEDAAAGTIDPGPANTGQRVRIWVEDNGIGIPQTGRKHIFDMFQKLHTGYPGTGIGLAIVRKAVERMGGKAGVESEPDKGSRFWLELPVAGCD